MEDPEGSRRHQATAAGQEETERDDEDEGAARQTAQRAQEEDGGGRGRQQKAEGRLDRQGGHPGCQESGEDRQIGFLGESLGICVGLSRGVFVFVLAAMKYTEFWLLNAEGGLNYSGLILRAVI